jgi:adenine-specific DNA-methyltransferase
MTPNEGVQGVVPGLDPTILQMKPLNHRPSRASIRQGTQQTDSSRQDSIQEMIERIQTERDLVALALQLGAEQVAGWSPEEKALTSRIPSPKGDLVEWAVKLIRRGEDPLGWAFCRLRTPEVRRAQGATYTPTTIVDAMLGWAGSLPKPARVVDPGVGSGRFLVSAGRRFPKAHLLGVELDPLAAITARAGLAASGLAGRSEVLLADYRAATIPSIAGRTLFIGNPPYVRHHLISAAWKRWLRDTAADLGIHASQLAGLHAYFLLATSTHAKAGDIGAFITAAEWLDVNYGHLLRQLFMGKLGGLGLSVIEPSASPFPDAITSAAILRFEVGARPRSVQVRRVEDLDDLRNLSNGRMIRRERLETASRWTPLTRRAKRRPEGLVELGEICQVHRGQVTGANDVWIAGVTDLDLPPEVLFPTVTKARELFDAGQALATTTGLRRVIDLPEDLDVICGTERAVVEAFLKRAKAMGADKSYTAKNRRAWWSVGLRPPAPILATYMARRPPAFVRNIAHAHHINIAHGLYPREPMSSAALSALARFLSTGVNVTEGRTYGGGLTKFEPKEMERILVPDPKLLVETAMSA